MGARRRRKAPLPINATSPRLHQAHDGRCPICKGTLLAVEDRPQLPQQWDKWLTTARTTIIKIATQEAGTSNAAELPLMHADCRTGGSPVRLIRVTALGGVRGPRA